MKSLYALVGTLMVSFPLLAGAHSLERLEEIANRAASLDEFLSRPELVREYGAALKEYYGRDRFRCESFETILAELRQLKEKVPGLKERLWKKEPTAPISFRPRLGGKESNRGGRPVRF